MTTLTAAPPTTPTTFLVVDDAIADALDYRAWALTRRFDTIQTGDETWRGIALLHETPLAERIAALLPGAQTRLTFFRQSPLGQVEPNFIHSDEGMGEWTAILYLNPEPAPGDGTTFWRYRPTGEVSGSARALDKDPACWEPWQQVDARFNRLLVFDSWYFHSRAIAANYGHGADARLIQVAFGMRPVAGPHLREATLADVPRLVTMGQRFRTETVYATRLTENPAQMATLAERLITTPEALVLVAERDGALVGMIGLIVFAHHLSGAVTAGEVFFWVEPEHRGYGVRLLRRAEQWAKTQGAVRMQLIAPIPDVVAPFYQRVGYEAIEVAYEKDL